MAKVAFGWAVPTFGGVKDSHIDTPLIDRVDFKMIRNIAEMCEERGFKRLWVADHLILGHEGRILESWTVISCLAAVTSKIRLGSKVLCYTFRHPSILAKAVSTLDVISNGRLDVGLGAGWYEEEAKRYGLTFPPLSVRIDQLAEYVEVLKKMFTEKSPSFNGKYYSLDNAICEPKPLQKPHPPIWIGTLRGGRKMFSLIARYADGVNTLGTLQSVKDKISGIREACASMGRRIEDLTISWDTHVIIGKTDDDVREIKREINKYNPNYPSYLFFTPDARRKHGIPDRLSWEEFEQLNLIGTPDKVIKRIDEFVEAGVRDFVLWFLDLPSHQGIKLFGEQVISSFT